MAKHSQHQQENSANDGQSKRGSGQAVVELCEISACGLVFWSRRRFEIGAEVQVRIHRSALPASVHGGAVTHAKWVTLKGFVVACPKHRRDDGSSGFQVSLLIEDMACAEKPKSLSRMRWLKTSMPWMTRFGLN